MNPLTGVCNSNVITQAQDQNVPGGSSSQIYDFGTGGFSISTPNEYISINSTTDTSSSSESDAYTFDPSTGNFTHSEVADVAYGMPIHGNAPAWQANTAYGYGAYVSYTLASSSQYPAWAANTSTFAPGDIIMPVAGCAFKLTVTGTTGSAPPNWNSVCTSNSMMGGLADGSATWKGIGGPPSFIFQNVSGSGTSGSSSPSFLNAASATAMMPGGHPDVLSTVSDNGITWENVGVNVGPKWTSFGSAGINDAYISVGLSNDTYGPGPGGYAQWNGDQGTGIFAVEYDRAINTYHLFNTATGIFTDFACPGGGYNCPGGSFTAMVLGKATGSTCEGYIHNVKAYYGNYVMVMRQATIGGTCGAGEGWIWRAPQSWNAGNQILEQPFQPNHWAVMHNALFAQAPSGYSTTLGVYGTVMPFATPELTPPANWVVYPCSPSGPPYANPPCADQGNVDSHLSAAYNPGGADTYPVAGTVFNIATLSPMQYMPWQGEEVAVSTSATTSNPGSGPLTGSTVWRFTHTFATGSNRAFDAQFSISQFSQDGQYLAFTTDWNGQLGSTTGIAPTVANGQLAVNPPAGVTYTCLGAPVWQASSVYATGALVGPIGGTGGTGTVYDVFQAVAGGTSGSSAPAWGSPTGTPPQLSDGTITWQDLGHGNCRADVVIAKLVPTVAISSGTDIQTAVNAAPAGTTFVLAPGTYRLTHSITPKTGDSFVGQIPCAPPVTPCTTILSGSTVIGPLATFDGTNYEVSGQSQQGMQATTPDCITYTGTPSNLYYGCIYPEDLFFDGVPLLHLYSTTLPTIGPGQWWFDYPNNIIYFHDNPAGHSVETSVVNGAFGGAANNVTLQYLTVEEFATMFPTGAIGTNQGINVLTQGANWTVQNWEFFTITVSRSG